MKTIVIAVGGNAILCADQKGTIEEQQENIKICCKQIADLIMEGYQIVLTHGNGPQVGSIIIQNDIARKIIPENPLDICDAQTQGSLGYMLTKGLYNVFQERGIKQKVVTLLSEVVVDENDPSFLEPAKFIGPFFSEQEAHELKEKKGFVMKQDSNRGFRRVVPSPEPLELVEEDAAKILLQHGYLVITVGGGGIPVIKSENGFQGIEAVIDKDYASALVAEKIGADYLVILTGVSKVAINYGTEQKEELDCMNLTQCEEYMKQGQFPAGSMGPKVDAARKFVGISGKEAIITSLDHLVEAMAGKNGTRIIC